MRAFGSGGTLLLAIIPLLANPVNDSLKEIGDGKRLMQQERYEEALHDFEIGAQLDPASMEARRGIAVCDFNLREYDPARAVLQPLLRNSTIANFARYYLGRIALIQNRLDDAIRYLRDTSANSQFSDELYYLAFAYFKKGEYAKSAQAVQRQIATNPRDFRAHFLAARVYQQLGKESQANAEFAETRRLHAIYQEGSELIKGCAALLAQAKPEEAWDRCGPFVDTDDPDKASAIGEVFGRAGQYSRARFAFERAKQLDPDSSEILFDLALTCYQLNDVSCARDNASAALRQEPEFPQAAILYATALYRLGADKDALPALRRAHAVDPEDALIRQMLTTELILWAEDAVQKSEPHVAEEVLSELDKLEPIPSEDETRVKKIRVQLRH